MHLEIIWIHHFNYSSSPAKVIVTTNLKLIREWLSHPNNYRQFLYLQVTSSSWIEYQLIVNKGQSYWGKSPSCQRKVFGKQGMNDGMLQRQEKRIKTLLSWRVSEFEPWNYTHSCCVEYFLCAVTAEFLYMYSFHILCSIATLSCVCMGISWKEVLMYLCLPCSMHEIWYQFVQTPCHYGKMKSWLGNFTVEMKVPLNKPRVTNCHIQIKLLCSGEDATFATFSWQPRCNSKHLELIKNIT